MDSNIITTIATGIGVLVGIHSIVNRSEDRTNRRIADLETRITDRFNGMEKLFTEKLLRVEQVMDARIHNLERGDKT